MTDSDLVSLYCFPVYHTHSYWKNLPKAQCSSCHSLSQGTLTVLSLHQVILFSLVFKGFYFLLSFCQHNTTLFLFTLTPVTATTVTPISSSLFMDHTRHIPISIPLFMLFPFRMPSHHLSVSQSSSCLISLITKPSLTLPQCFFQLL